MLMLAQDPWSHAEVRKLIALIATEHLRTQAAFDAIPTAVGVLTQEFRVIWANQQLRSLVPAMQETQSGVRDALQRAARTGVITEVAVGSEPVRLRFFPTRSIPGEIVVMAISDERCLEADNAFAALEHCNVAVFVYNLEGHVLYANSEAAELTGYDRETLRRVTLRELSPEHYMKLTELGDCTVSMRNVAGPGAPLRCRVKATVVDGERVFSLTVIGAEEGITSCAGNLAVLEGCLVGAFPGSVVSRAPATHPETHRFRIVTETHERVLTVTTSALRSNDFRAHLREIPEALNLTRAVILTENGVGVD